MQQPRMIVLALIGSGLRYGFEMEEFVQTSQMRQWAKIGMSTIYKILSDLVREDAVKVEMQESDKGPARKAYSLTRSGRAEMHDLIVSALASESSVYSDRMAGLAFSRLLAPEAGSSSIEAAIGRLESVEAELAEREADLPQGTTARAIVAYYRDVYRAERRAMRTILDEISSKA